MTTYIIEAENSGRLKIGHTTGNPMERKRALATGSSERLRIVAVLNDVSEVELHDRFRESRLHGEWFEPSSKLRAFINGLTPFGDNFDGAPAPHKGRTRGKSTAWDWDEMRSAVCKYAFDVMTGARAVDEKYRIELAKLIVSRTTFTPEYVLRSVASRVNFTDEEMDRISDDEASEFWKRLNNLPGPKYNEAMRAITQLFTNESVRRAKKEEAAA